MAQMPDLSSILRRGVRMEQHKEPALSRPLELLTCKPGYSVIEGAPLLESIDQIEPYEIIRRAKQARIIDERDGLPLFKKLRACVAKNVTIRVDAVDDEPYITSQLAPLIHMREELAGGMKLAQKAIGAQNCVIEVYRNMTDLESRIPLTVGGFRVKRIGGVYPAEIRSGYSLVEEDGNRYLYIGTCALVHLYRAVYEARVQETAIITVSGNCVSKPCNMEVGLGIPVTDVLDRCGLTNTPTRVVVGGSMTGETVEDSDSVVVTVTSRAVLALVEDERNRRYNCIRCGRCTEVCPVRLNPMLIYQSIMAGQDAELQNLDYQSCIQCMCCSFECPAKLNIAATIAGYRRRRTN
ncbi:MAG: SLBB domain-containing protein [Angelakisella sp.]